MLIVAAALVPPAAYAVYLAWPAVYDFLSVKLLADSSYRYLTLIIVIATAGAVGWIGERLLSAIQRAVRRNRAYNGRRGQLRSS